MSESTVTVVGRVATDVNLTHVDGGRAKATFRVASNERRYDREQGGYVNGPTSFATVVCWRSLAENVSSSLGKGQPVVVTGRFRVHEWTRDDGTTRVNVDIDARAVGHSLVWGTTAFRRSSRPDGAESADGTDGDERDGDRATVVADAGAVAPWSPDGVRSLTNVDDGTAASSAGASSAFGVDLDDTRGTPASSVRGGRDPWATDPPSAADADGQAA